MSSSRETSQQEALIQLMSPDGYYTYLGIEKVRVSDGGSPASTTQSRTLPAYSVDEDSVKKAYRKLSLRHHPDKGGDVNTFRLLTRAQRVLIHPKLRAQYDNLGIDLDDDEEDHPVEDGGSGDDSKKIDDQGNGLTQGIVSELASLALTGIIQLAIRTMLMGLVAVVIVRYRWTVFPALLFMGYVVFQVAAKAAVRGGSVYDSGSSIYDALSPALIIVGLIFMFLGRKRAVTTVDGGGEALEWTWTFWIGETMVIALFTYNSISSVPWNSNILAMGGLGLGAGLLALLFRGKFYNYLILILLELVLAVLVAMAFPIMELLLEAILNEKFKKVGEKIRDHHRQLEQYYARKLKEQGKDS